METNPHQSPQAEIPPPEAVTRQPDHPFRSAVEVGALLQLALFLLTVLILDGGWTNKLCIMSMIGYWIAVLAIRIRRGAKPSAGDLLFLRYGVAVLFILSFAVARLVYSLIGESPLSGWERWFR